MPAADKPHRRRVRGDKGDDNFDKLVADYMGSQTGEALNLNKKPCRNRLLIQVGLLREDNQLSWGAVVDWLQKIFPMYQSADFRCLIERGIATTLSLNGDARQAFLESNVNFELVGPICDSIGVGRADLLEMTDFSEQAESIEVTNGLILELSNFVIREKIDPIVLVSWLRQFDPEFCSDGNIQKASKVLQAKLKKFRLHYRNYQTTRHRRNAQMETFLQSPFELVKDPTDGKKSGKRGRKKRGFLSKLDKPVVKIFKEESETFAITPNEEGVWESYSQVKVKEEYESPTEESHHAMNQNTLDLIENPDASKGEALTLLDIAMLSVQKLSSVYGGKTDASKQVSLDLLKNQYTLTCKENVAMKFFEEKVASLKDQHSMASPLRFLHYNAHFLVDIHDAIEQQMMSFENEIMQSTGEKLGRDRNPKFRRFVNFSESSTSRYIHMACDVLSPRAASKQNYRKHWIAFCEEKNNPSKLTVNRSNRFNNYFEAAAGLIHHYGEIALFFSDLLLLNNDECPNVILESVTDDANDDVIQSLVCVLAIVYCKILGPYWQLLKSGGEYSLFSQYILCLYQKLLEWAKDASGLLEPDTIANVFLQLPLQEKTFDGVFSYFTTGSGHIHVDLIRVCLQKMVKVIAAVTEVNLSDFLPGGAHCHNPRLEISTKLTTCTFSVLMAEYPFGHAYPYKRKRPDQLTNLASSNNEEPEGHSIPSEGGSPAGATNAERKTSDTVPREEYSPPSKKKYLDQSKAQKRPVGRPRKDPGPVTKDQRLQDETNRNAVIAAVAKNGGPCNCKQDVDRLLARLDGTSHAQKREAIRCEISYQKLVLDSRDPSLNHIGFSLADMISKLNSVLPGEACSLDDVSASGQENERKANEHNEQQSEHENVTTTPADAQSGQSVDYESNKGDLGKGQRSIDLGGNKNIVSYQSYRGNFDEFH
ncbi:uncharacterized protein LOC121586263 isoform X2 [Coregonus clupeaformis]|uniref:uncharacterized protein LOC121586263 isoform X2 n=1 Tax=Coregonus clupeaformis TaxID=59861 RepID=UPI001BDF819D|nr:uncharacterized protein LOC121586263 isoform X2 [Coregonus clupeaformis]